MPRASKKNALKSDGTLKAGYRQSTDKNGRVFYMSPPCNEQVKACKDRKNEYKNAYQKCIKVNKKLKLNIKNKNSTRLRPITPTLQPFLMSSNKDREPIVEKYFREQALRQKRIQENIKIRSNLNKKNKTI
jgi:hypothetical protein